MDYENYLILRWSGLSLSPSSGLNGSEESLYPVFPPPSVKIKKRKKCRSCKRKKRLMKTSSRIRLEWKKQVQVKLVDIAKDSRYLRFFKEGLITAPGCRPSIYDSSSTSGISGDDQSDNGGNPNTDNAVQTTTTVVKTQNVLSETSDYQRSTPSPRDRLFLEDVFQIHDEFVDSHLQKPDLGFEDDTGLSSWSESGALSPFERKTIYLNNEKLKVLSDFVYDPKIMFQRPKVILSPLKKKTREEDNEDSPRKHRHHHHHHHHRHHHHRRKRRKRRKRGEASQSTKYYYRNLIRPARLHFYTDSKVFFGSKFSSSSANNNPFLPVPQQSSFLFGTVNNRFSPVIEDDIEEEVEEILAEDNKAALRVLDEVAPSSDEERLFYNQTVKLENKEDSEKAVCEKEVKNEEINVVGDEEEDEEEEDDDEEEEDPTPLSSSDSSQHPIRFPPSNDHYLNKNTIDCKWDGCQVTFTSYGKLSDHLKTVHVEGQAEDDMFHCLWEGCKVYRMKSCSQSWLEKHVPTHGGKYALACIVSGCKMRFSSQKTLQKHVNNHFSRDETECANPAAKKLLSENSSESTKNLKRAGVKLKFRKTVFSARIFDVFHAGVMASIRHSLFDMEKEKVNLGIEQDFESEGGEDVIAFRVKTVKGLRTINGPEGKTKQILVRWTPEDLLEDEWIDPSFNGEKVLKVRSLPPETRSCLGKRLFPVPPTECGRRKRRINQ